MLNNVEYNYISSATNMDEQREIFKLVGYCRVSTDNQKEEGTIEIQKRALREYADDNNHELVKVFSDEGISGGLENRPALGEMIKFLEDNKEINGVLIFKLDRLARDLYIQEHLIKKFEGLGKALHSIKEPHLDSSDPMRKAFRQFMGIVSELEKAFITMRLSAGRINKARKGGYSGGSPALGYLPVGKELNHDESGAEVIKRIFHMKRYKRIGLREIARLLNDEGIPTARGGQWRASTVKYILDNPLYKGNCEYKGVIVKNPDLALI